MCQGHVNVVVVSQVVVAQEGTVSEGVWADWRELAALSVTWRAECRDFGHVIGFVCRFGARSLFSRGS